VMTVIDTSITVCLRRNSAEAGIMGNHDRKTTGTVGGVAAGFVLSSGAFGQVSDHLSGANAPSMRGSADAARR
jgi:hypothetical protein